MSTQINDTAFELGARRVLKIATGKPLPKSLMVTTAQAEAITEAAGRPIDIKSLQRYAKDSLSHPRSGKLKGVKKFGRLIMIPLRSLEGLELGTPGPKRPLA